MALTVARELWFAVVVLALWWVLSSGSTSFYFPPLSEIWARFQELWLFDRVPTDVWPSLRNFGLAIVLSCAVGIPLGVVLGSLRRVREIVSPVLGFGWALPKLALLPAFIAVAGIGDGMRVSFILAGAVWPILLGAQDGVRAVDPGLRDMARSYRFGRGTLLFRVLLPAAAPQIFAGIRTSLAIGLVLMIVGEMLVASSGLGFFVLQSQQSYALVDMWAGALLIGMLGYLITLLFTVLERFVLRWHFARRAMHAAG
ncbi:ABC transporter permease [Nocardioides carbamazepini]|uniref:ABC transporter permease n=1 Tax=Nocardioides carbamazepini TaxID=2854259 RepID=UPI002149CB42|nr:ABC transporter permease [Nocardioides carbamazepini]MCR1784987.1 ABC transporter permease [Nocardioides carbamazepini]